MQKLISFDATEVSGNTWADPIECGFSTVSFSPNIDAGIWLEMIILFVAVK